MDNQNDILRRVKLLMEYNSSMTLNENILVLEQKSDFLMDRQSNAIMQSTGLRSKKDAETVNRIITDASRIKIDAPSVSELLSKTREYLFTPGGMTAQLVLSIAGAELGLPVVFTVLDIAILINDFSIMVKNWKESDNKDEESWFTYQWENNKGFQLVIEDLLLILIGAAIKLVGKSGKSVYSYFRKKFGKGIVEVVEVAEKEIVKKESLISRLPKKIADWAKSQLNQLKKGLELLKTPKLAAKSVVKNIPKAAGLGYANYKFIKWLEKKTETSTKTDSSGILSAEDSEYMSYIVADNPEIFKIETKGDRSIGDFWDYKRDLDGNYYAKNTKDGGDWVLASGKAKEAIKEKIESEIIPTYKFESFKIEDKKNKIFNINGKKYQVIKPAFKVKEI